MQKSLDWLKAHQNFNQFESNFYNFQKAAPSVIAFFCYLPICVGILDLYFWILTNHGFTNIEWTFTKVLGCAFFIGLGWAMKNAKLPTEVAVEPIPAAPKKKKAVAKKSSVWRKRQIAAKKQEKENLNKEL